MCKEVMLSVRADSNPLVYVDNLEVTIFNALEINVFPGAQYEICVRITRELVDFLHKYFSIKMDSEVDSAETTTADKENEAPTRPTQQSALYVKYLRVGDINVEVN